MKTIGLTGGIGTGKSTVARFLSERHGVTVIDADQVSRDVVAPGTPGLHDIVQAFGDVLLADGTLDRRALRTIIMNDGSCRARLEALLHPRIFTEIHRQLQVLRDKGHRAAVVEAALMVETGSYQQYDALIVVSAEPATQVARVMNRDRVSQDQAERVLRAQLSMRDKEAVATHIIDNDGTIEELAVAVDRCWRVIGPQSEPVEHDVRQ
jgi:dephospho-CoA kinase